MNCNGSMPRPDLPDTRTVTEPADVQALHRELLKQASERYDTTLLTATQALAAVWKAWTARSEHGGQQALTRELANEAVAAVLRGLTEHYDRQKPEAMQVMQQIVEGWVTQIRMTMPAKPRPWAASQGNP